MKMLYRSPINIFTLLIAIGATFPAHAAQLFGNITADNYYGLYHGQLDGSGLVLAGRNEQADFHSPDTTPPLPGAACDGSFSWSCPESWELNVNPGDYLYVVAWDEGGAQTWIGDFQLPDGTELLSNITDWEYTIASGANPFAGALPDSLEIATEIANATWSIPQAAAPQGSSPWGTIPGISESAQFIWHDTLADGSLSDANYVIFRSKAPVAETVPEPATVLGLVLLGITYVASKSRSF